MITRLTFRVIRPWLVTPTRAPTTSTLVKVSLKRGNIVIFFVKDQFVYLEIIVCWTPNKPEHIERFHFQLNNRDEINLDIIEAPFTVDP